MRYDLDNLECWHCGNEIPGSLVRKKCPLCGALNPEESPWDHITSVKWRPLLKRVAIAGFLTASIVMLGFLLTR